MARISAAALRASLESDEGIAALASTDAVVTTPVPGEGDAADSTPKETTEEVAVVEEEVSILPSDETETAVIDNSDSLEEAIVEADEAQDASDEELEKTEELEEATQGLESILLTLESYSANGKVDDSVVAAANVAMGVHARKLGIQDEVRLSNESLSLSMEQAENWVKRAWEALKKAVAAVWDSIVNFLKRVFTATGRLKARGDRLQKLQLSGDPKEKEMRILGLAKRLAVGTKVQLDPVKGLKELTALVSTTSEWAHKLNKGVLDIRVTESFMSMIGNHSYIKSSKPAGFNLEPYRESGLKLSSDLLPGNVRFVGYAAPRNFFGTIDKVRERQYLDASTMVKVQSPEEIRKTGKAVSDLVRVIEAANARLNAAKKKGIMNSPKVGSILLDQAENADGFKNRLTADAALVVIRRMETVPFQLAAKVIAHATSVAAAYVELAERSAVQYAKAKSSNESIAYSEEGVKGAIVGFLTGAAATPLVVTRALHGAAFKASREKLKSEILQISDRIAAIRNGDIEKAKKSGIKIDEKDLKPIDKFEVAKSAALGLIVPFYGTYQGHKREELQEELKAKIKELRKEFAKQGIHS